MPSAIVLGAGMVGSVMATDLAGDFDVTIADVRPENLKQAASRAGGRVRTIEADLSDTATVAKLIKPFDIVLGALASRIGFQTLRAVIEAGKNYCDISFMPEDAWELDALAKQHGVTAVVDCGVAPGMSNLLAGYASSLLDVTERIDIMVGGLPRERRWPFEYKAGFAPSDVIEEYCRPARIVEHSKLVVRPALSEPELVDLPGVGTIEAFNTDGLRSMAYFLKAPFMRERTLRYPGHIELMRVMRETGLFSREPVTVTGVGGGKVQVRPIDVTSALLFPKWSYQPGEEDLTVMRVTVEGQAKGKLARYEWDLLDFYDRATGTTSMSRTTAFPAAIVARQIASGALKQTGVNPPELLGRHHTLVNTVLTELRNRNVQFTGGLVESARA